MTDDKSVPFVDDSSDRDWLELELEEALDEAVEAEFNEPMMSTALRKLYRQYHPQEMDRRTYFRELLKLQTELIKLQYWVEQTGEKVLVIFEGRDAAGKGGVIKRITQRLNPRVCRVVALAKPSDRERTQWYFQRYVQHLPSGGEIALFDRSWYNRAGVERVMGFATPEEIEQFFRDAPEFERMLVRSGIHLLKYWFSITDEEQQLRFLMRIHDPMKQWKLSPMDLQSRIRWEEYTKAKEDMFDRTNIPEAPWYIVEGNDKKRQRLNCISHFLSKIPYHDVPRDKVDLPDRVFNPNYERKVLPTNLYVPNEYRKKVMSISVFPRILLPAFVPCLILLVWSLFFSGIVFEQIEAAFSNSLGSASTVWNLADATVYFFAEALFLGCLLAVRHGGSGGAATKVWIPKRRALLFAAVMTPIGLVAASLLMVIEDSTLGFVLSQGIKATTGEPGFTTRLWWTIASSPYWVWLVGGLFAPIVGQWVFDNLSIARKGSDLSRFFRLGMVLAAFILLTTVVQVGFANAAAAFYDASGAWGGIGLAIQSLVIPVVGEIVAFLLTATLLLVPVASMALNWFFDKEIKQDWS